MTISVDTSIVSYALEVALKSGDSEKINYICNRIGESVPMMQRVLCQTLIDDLDDYFENHEPTYLKLSPLRRLEEILKIQRKEFKS